MKPKTKPKTKQQIILETVAYYGADPTRRGVYGGVLRRVLRGVLSSTGCVYLTRTGKMCAIGRLMTDDGLMVHYLDGDTFADEIDPKYIRPEYRDALADPKFARALQRLHDKDSYWNGEGLTEEGKQALSDMLDRRWSN